MSTSAARVVGTAGAACGLLIVSPLASEPRRGCPEEMARAEVSGRSFCVDRWEAHLERIADDGSAAPHAPNKAVNGKRVRAKSAPGVIPQAYVSRDEAELACREAGKRLCSDDEWLAACRGPSATRFPYGERWRRGACNDRGVSPLGVLDALGKNGEGSAEAWGHRTLNDPRLHLVPGGVARTGRFTRCQDELGVHDMVGNLHEWTADPKGTFRGGYYLDTDGLGVGCSYAAVGHDRKYTDYSTGFRCCADPR